MRVLGRVIDVKQDLGVGWVEPLYEVNGSKVLRRIDDPEKDFPENGEVFWPAPLTDAQKGDFIFFTPGPNHRNDKGHRYLANAPELAVEVLDLRNHGDEDAVLRRLRKGGLYLPHDPYHKLKCLVWTGDRVVGPVRLQHSSTGWSLAPSVPGQQLQLYQLGSFRAADLPIERVSENPARWFLMGPLPDPEDACDWDEEPAVLKRALKFMSDGSGPDMKMTKAQIDDAVDRLTKEASAEPGSAPQRAAILRARLNRHRLERLGRLLPEVQQTSAIAADLGRALLEHPALKPELEKEREAARKAARQEAEQTLAATRSAIESESKRLRELEVKVSAEKATLASTQRDHEAKLIELKQAQDAEVARLAEALEKRVEEALESPAALLSEAALLRAVMPRAVAPAATPAVPNTAPTHSAPTNAAQRRPRSDELWTSRAGRVFNEPKELTKPLVESFKRRGLPADVARAFQGSMIGGLVPIAAGAGGMEAIEAYAEVVAAGRLGVVSVGPSMTEACDLFGRIGSDGYFSPHQSGLLDIVLGAQAHPDKLVVVALEGINRAPTEGALLTLLELASGARSTGLRLFADGAARPDDPYGSCALIRLPRNVLFTATLREGPTTLPLAPAVLAHAAIIALELEEPPTERPTTPPTLSEVGAGSNILTPAATVPKPCGELFGAVVQSEPALSVRARLWAAQRGAERLARGLQAIASPPVGEPGLRRIVVNSSIAPALAMLPEADLERTLAPLLTALQGHEPPLDQVVQFLRRWLA